MKKSEQNTVSKTKVEVLSLELPSTPQIHKASNIKQL